jgi:hypothetical protein
MRWTPLYVLLAVVGSLWAGDGKLHVMICTVCADSVSNPYAGIDFNPYVTSASENCGEAEERDRLDQRQERWPNYRDWWPKRNWYDGAPRVKPAKKGDLLPDTGAITDVWGRHYFEPADHIKGTLPTEWRVRTENGVLWRLLLVSEEESDSVYLRRATFEIWRNDTLVYRGETRHDEVHNFAESAWVWKDTCIISLVSVTRAFRTGSGLSYEGHHRILRNGEELPCTNCFDYPYICSHPFFFQQNPDSSWGWTYNGTAGSETFRELFFDKCCEPAMWDVQWRPDGFQFFAERERTWYKITGKFSDE